MNLNDLLNMGGYGIYVWPTYVITLLVFFFNFLITLFEKKKIKKIIKQSL